MGVVIVVDVVLVAVVMAVVVDTLVGVIAIDVGVTGVVNADVDAGVLVVNLLTVTVPVVVVLSLTKVGSVMVGSVMVGSVMVGSVISIRFIGRFPGFDMIFVFSRFITAFSAGLIKFVSVNNSSVGFDSPDINVITVLDIDFIIVDEEELLGVAVGAVTDCSVMVKAT